MDIALRIDRIRVLWTILLILVCGLECAIFVARKHQRISPEVDDLRSRVVRHFGESSRSLGEVVCGHFHFTQGPKVGKVRRLGFHDFLQSGYAGLGIVMRRGFGELQFGKNGWIDFVG